MNVQRWVSDLLRPITTTLAHLYLSGGMNLLQFRNLDGFDGFKRFLKTILFSRYQCDQRIRGF